MYTYNVVFTFEKGGGVSASLKIGKVGDHQW